MKTKKNKRALIFLPVFFLLLASCASGPPGSRGQRPDWVLKPPDSNANNVFFVGSGSDETGDIAAAENRAVTSLVSDVTRHIGVKITSETTVEARATLETFEEEVTAVINESSSARLSDFRIVDKYVEQTAAGAAVIYLLGSYDRQALDQEKERFQKLFAERLAAVSGPEAEGDDKAGNGEFFSAAVSYLEAAAATLDADIDNAEVKFERNITKARESINRINLFPLNDNLTADVGKPFPEQFRLKVVSGTSRNDSGVEGVSVSVSYKELRTGGRLGTKTVNLQSDAEGVVSFTHPVPQFVGDATVIMALDMRAMLDPLSDVDGKAADLRDGLQRALNEKRVTFKFSVVSAARTIPSLILLFDFDKEGGMRGSANSANGVLEAMSAQGFSVKTVVPDENYIGIDDGKLIALLSESIGNAFQRLIFGEARITAIDESDDVFVVRVEGSIKAADLSSGEIVFAVNKFMTSRGRSAESATAAAFRELGKSFGEELARGLP